MIFLNYFLALVITFFGIFLGSLLVLMAPEEQKPGRKYFILFRDILLLLVIFFLLYFNNLSLSFGFIFVFVIVFLLAYFKENSYFVYLLFAAVLYLSSKEVSFFIIESSLIFLYGLPTGSLLVNYKRKKSIFKVFYYLYYVFIAALLFLII